MGFLIESKIDFSVRFRLPAAISRIIAERLISLICNKLTIFLSNNSIISHVQLPKTMECFKRLGSFHLMDESF